MHLGIGTNILVQDDRWFYISENSNRDLYYYDKLTIEYEGNIVKEGGK